MHAEEEIMADPEVLSGLLDQFCLQALPWFFRNSDDAKGIQTMLVPDVGPKPQPRSGVFEDVMTEYGNHVFMPALWREKTIVAYSRTGYKSRVWKLPSEWKDIEEVAISRITLDGPVPVARAMVSGGTLMLSLKEREALSISPSFSVA